jgi:L-ascorbate metabolism protein UlaG (beta-lactamase superfamily)
MSAPLLYLKPSAQFEPLLHGWYAWSHLISPATAAMITVNSHVRVMESFLQHPDLHRRAVTEQSMKGGMFMDYAGEPERVSDLLDATRARLGHCVTFVQAVGQLNERLARKTDGQSLASVYTDVPEPLRGVVELVYDLNHRPSYRIVEPLLYASEYYDESLQSIRFFTSGSDERPFVLSSPRFEEEGTVELRLPFRSPLVDRLARLRHTPAPRADIDAWLAEAGLDAAARERFSGFLTDEAPRLDAQRNYDGDGVRVRYFGHATVLVQSRGVSFLLDPALSTAQSGGPPRFTYDDLPDTIDYVLLTHNHQDHVMLEALLQLRHKIGTIVVPRSNSGSLQDPSLKLMLRAIGFANVVELDEVESLPTPVGSIVGLPFFGEHADLDIRTKLGYCVRAAGRGFVFLADSNALEPTLYDRLKRHVGPIDSLFIGLECEGAPLSWLYGPLYSKPLQRSVDQSRRLNSSDAGAAIEIIGRLGAEQVYVYAMGMEPWLGFISSISYTDASRPIVESDRLLAACAERGIPAERLYLQKEVVYAPRDGG